ncbi:MAG TPA: M20/M25/M40 family metallo-hydrolase [Chitinophagaceae bacterium]|nr:M20/M25/M40 family metallo-hydrolase [Chitinophagaceae bacterium]
MFVFRRGLPLLRIIIVIAVINGCSSSKQVSKTDTETLNNLHNHIQYLADDKLEGRRTGTPGEQLAVDYITKQFEKIGLSPKGTEYYIQSFIVNDGKQIDSTTFLSINGEKLETGKDFFPFPFSPDIKLQAIPSIAVMEAAMPWFFDLKDPLNENKNNPHFDIEDYVRKNSQRAAERGASAVFLYNTSSIDDKLEFNAKDRSEQLKIPVIYIKKGPAKKFFSDLTAAVTVNMNVSLSEKTRLGHNVIGYIDNKAPTTVILGAHFDHLGYGEDGNSRNTSHEPAIHNGADDNASGTAALIELARKLKTSKAKSNNYLFIAFSGEELGLFGSKYFTEHPTIDLSSADYMINMDMVGRLNDSTKVLTVGGYGTSPAWGSFYQMYDIAHVKRTELNFKYDSSGTGPSDHTSFYRKDIPVLFYFTGLHADYHKPSDDADKINYEGELLIVDHILKLIESLDNQPKLAFTKTRETQTTTSARFSVSMGIMPDYTYPGSGVRADGVSEGKPAQKAGLIAGDVIIQIGDYSVSSLENYMQALGKFKKGDKTKVKFKRGEEIKEATIEF